MNWFHRLPDNLKGIVYLMLASIVFSLMALLIKLLDQLPGLPTWFGAVIVVAAAIFTIYRRCGPKVGWPLLRTET